MYVWESMYADALCWDIMCGKTAACQLSLKTALFLYSICSLRVLRVLLTNFCFLFQCDFLEAQADSGAPAPAHVDEDDGDEIDRVMARGEIDQVKLRNQLLFGAYFSLFFIYLSYDADWPSISPSL